MNARLAEMTAGITARAGACPVRWETRDGHLHLICPQDGQSVFRVFPGLAFTLDGAAAHIGAHLRQCHES